MTTRLPSGDTSKFCRTPSVVRFRAEKGARMDVWNRPDKNGWTPSTIAEGIKRGMNIVSSAPTAAAIRQVMTTPDPASR